MRSDYLKMIFFLVLKRIFGSHNISIASISNISYKTILDLTNMKIGQMMLNCLTIHNLSCLSCQNKKYISLQSFLSNLSVHISCFIATSCLCIYYVCQYIMFMYPMKTIFSPKNYLYFVSTLQKNNTRDYF